LAIIVQLDGVDRPMLVGEAVTHLAERGFSPWTIYEILKAKVPNHHVTSNSIKTMMYKGRKEGLAIPRYHRYGVCRVK
jgi:cytochrome bd-type quinol oxidase subunit 1